MTTDTQLLISFVKTKVSSEGKIIDTETLNSINKLTQSLAEIITNEKEELLSALILLNEGINNGKT